MSLSDKRVLVFGTGGTIQSSGYPLRPNIAIERVIKDDYVNKNMKFIYKSLPRRWDSGNIKAQEDIGETIGHTIYRMRNEVDGVMIAMGTGQAARINAGVSLLFRYTLDLPILGWGCLIEPERADSDAPTKTVNAVRFIAAFIEERVRGMHWSWGPQAFSGSRLIKVSPEEPAFVTPEVQPIAKYSDGAVYIHPSAPTKEDLTSADAKLHWKFSKHVHSNISVNVDDDPWLLKMMAKSGRYKAVTITVPDMPTRPWGHVHTSWIDAISYATSSGMLVFNSPPWQGTRSKLDTYELGYKAKKAGVIELPSYTPGMVEMIIRQGVAECGGDRDRTVEFVRNDEVRAQLQRISKPPEPSIPKAKVA